MEAGSRSADSRLLDLVGDIHGLLDLDEFREGLIVALRRVVETDWASLNEFGPGPEDVWSLVAPPLPDEILELFARHAHENPLLRHAKQMSAGSAYRLSDVISRKDFHRLELYREVYAPIGLEYQMAFTLPHEPPRLLGVALSRKHKDFTDAERDLVNRARPFLIQGYRNALAFSGPRPVADSGTLLEALRQAGLTPREADTMRLVALGRSNAKVAEGLGLSVRTVHKHLEHCYAKLGVCSRSEAGVRAWALASEVRPARPARPARSS